MPEISKEMLRRMRAETLAREITIDRRAIDEEARTVDLAFASETPVERWFGQEILDVTRQAMRLDRMRDGAAVLVGHDSRAHVGVVEEVRIGKDRVARAKVRFGRSQQAQEVFQDIVDGIRRHVSVGYQIHRAVLEESSDEADVYRIVDWEPFEVSIVAVPADATVGVGRDKPDSAQAERDGGAAAVQSAKKEVVMPDTKKKENQAAPIDLAAERKKAREEALAAERDRVREIEAAAKLAVRFLPDKADALAREAIAAGEGVDEFRLRLLEAAHEAAAEARRPIGLTEQEAAGFRFNRLLRALVHPSNAAFRDDAAFELEVCAETAKRFKGQKIDGALIPTDVLSRAVTTTVAASTIQTDVLAQSFIDLLRNRMVVRSLGATVLGGLDGNISIPRQTGGGTAYWVAEGGQPTEADQTFDNLSLSPKGVAALTQTTLQNIMQSSLDMEAFIRSDLAKVIALAIDLAAINGSGTGNQPTGILNTTGIGSVAMGTNGAALSDVDPFVDLETAVADANADIGTMNYLTNAKVVGALKKLKTTTGEYLFKEPIRDLPSAVGSVNGYNLARSNQVPKNLTKGTGTNLSAALFGVWEELIIGEWGALNVQVDPYTAGIGNIKISVLQFVDLGVRHAQSFAAITDIVA